MTLISVYNSEGCIGRCDSRCYNAVGGTCDCICGGMNHGAGLATALDNARDRWADRYDELRKQRGGELVAEVNQETQQPSLAFGDSQEGG